MGLNINKYCVKTSNYEKQKKQILENFEIVLATGRQPLVSIIVTNFNYGRFLPDCLQSIYDQIYDNWECILVDNNSTDNSVEIMTQFKKQIKNRCIILPLTENYGQMGGMSIGFGYAKGEFICFMDSDDVWYPHSLKTHLAVHMWSAQVAFTDSRLSVISEKGNLLGVSNHRTRKFLTGNDYIKHEIQFPLYDKGRWPWGCTSGFMFRKSILDIVMPQSEYSFSLKSYSYVTCADNYINHMANLIGTSFLINEPLFMYRVHSNNSLAFDSLFGYNSEVHGGPHPSQATLRHNLAEAWWEARTSITRIIGGYLYLRYFFLFARWPEIKKFIKRKPMLGYTWGQLLKTLLQAKLVGISRRTTEKLQRANSLLKILITNQCVPRGRGGLNGLD